MRFTFSYREKLLIIILIVLILFATSFKILKNSVFFVYNHPQTNIKTFDYISTSIIDLDEALRITSRLMGSDPKYKVKYLFKNYYGSGFLKENYIPNDLDSTVGVYLGEFEYDGTNTDAIANSVMSKISIFETAFVEATSSYKPNSLINERTVFKSLSSNIFATNTDKKSFNLAIQNAFSYSSKYVIMLNKSAIDDKTIRVNIPYVMENNEILIENLEPFHLYSNSVVYNSFMKNYLREFSVIFDFFIDVRNKQSGEIKRFQLVPEAFIGDRLQFSRRMFVPNVFTGFESLLYLKNYDFLKNKEQYLANRIYNLERYIQIFEYNANQEFLYIKMLKRLHQAVDAFNPLLTKQERCKYYSIIGKYLKDESIANLNDISNITALLEKITLSKHLLIHFRKQGDIERLSNAFDDSLFNLKSTSKFNTIILNNIKLAKDELVNAIFNTNSEYEYDNLVKLAKTKKFAIYTLLKELYPTVINKAELIRISDDLKLKILDSGYKRLRIYWIDEKNIGVLKCNDIENISEQEFKVFALASGLPDVNYKFINRDDLNDKLYANSLIWIRLNPTVTEDKQFNSLKYNLLNDKNSYSIKTKFILKRIF